MKTRVLGNTNIKLFEIGLGCMGMSEFYGPTDEQESIATLHRALELGINFFDTADMYGSGANERLLAKAFKNQWKNITLATKFGIMRDQTQPQQRSINGQPAYVKKACEASLARLGIEVIDLYYLHRVDPEVPIEETVGAMADLVKEGKVRYLGLSEVSVETLKRAGKIHPITAVQSEYSLWTRGPEKEMLPYCEAHQISFVAYSPLGRGFLTHKINAITDLAENDFRKNNPRFSEDNFEKNHELVEKLNSIAIHLHCTAAQLSLAWVLAKSPKVIPIPGTKRHKYLEENVRATELKLNPSDIDALDQIFVPDAISGTRYAEAAMKNVDG